MPLSRGCWLSVTERSVLCHPGGRARMWRSRTSLRGYYFRGCCPLVPRSRRPVLCGGKVGPGLTRACSPGHITAYGVETGPWALLPRSCSYHPPPSHGVSRLGVRVCPHILKCCLYYFLEILDFISSESLVPS